MRENVTLLRLVRVFRVLRVVSVMPDLRVLIRGMVSSIAPIASLGLFAVLIMYVYGMVGWALFHEGDPENWATIGDAILTLFVVMTLESWPDIMGSAMEVNSWAWVYFVSYVLVASFLIINVVIAIIISAVEEARDEERHEAAVEAAQAAAGDGDVNADFHDPARIRERIADLRLALDELEAETGVVPAAAAESRRARGRCRRRSSGRSAGGGRGAAAGLSPCRRCRCVESVVPVPPDSRSEICWRRSSMSSWITLISSAVSVSEDSSVPTWPSSVSSRSLIESMLVCRSPAAPASSATPLSSCSTWSRSDLVAELSRASTAITRATIAAAIASTSRAAPA